MVEEKVREVVAEAATAGAATTEARRDHLVQAVLRADQLLIQEETVETLEMAEATKGWVAIFPERTNVAGVKKKISKVKN